MGAQRTFVHSRTAYYSWLGWQNSTWGCLSSSSGSIPWPQWNEMRFLQDPFEPSWSKKQETTTFHTFFWCLDYGNYVSHETPALCSFIYVDVGEPTSPMAVMMQDHHLLWLRASWSHLGHLFAGIAIPSWRSTERPEDFFSESVVSHLVLRVSFCGVLVLFLVGFVLFLFGRHLAFCFHLFSNMWE